MGQQSVRQAARRVARDAQAARSRARAASEARVGALAVEVAVALAERDAAVAACEVRAGRALRDMVDVEAVPLREALQWCGGVVSVREAARLRRVAADADQASGGDGDAAPTPATASPPGAVVGVEVEAGRATLPAAAIASVSGEAADGSNGAHDLAPGHPLSA